MKKYNIIAVLDKNKENVLMCKRTKPPYQDKLNFVGGKVEEGENELDAAYRELKEETGITKKDIKITNLMNIQYCLNNMELEVYAGTLKEEIKTTEELNKLEWINLNENFFDTDKFAGNGNIGHILLEMKCLKD